MLKSRKAAAASHGPSTPQEDHEQGLGQREPADLQGPGPARPHQRGVEPAVVDDQVGGEGDRIGGEDRELGHQQEDPGPADEERLVGLLEDLWEPLSTDAKLPGTASRITAGRRSIRADSRSRLSTPRSPMCGEACQVETGRAVDDPAQQFVRRDEERAEVAVLLALHEAIGQARVAPPEPLGRVGGVGRCPATTASMTRCRRRDW